MSTYAAGTNVASERSISEIRSTLRRYGAQQFMYGEGVDRASVEFIMRGRRVRFVMAMPNPDAREFTHTPARNTRRTATQQLAEYEQAIRQRWRALALVVKAKLEAVEAGITDFDTEFMAQTVLPNGQTVAECVRTDVEYAYANNAMPDLLPLHDATRKAITA